MKSYKDSTYGESIADSYDDWYGEVQPQMLASLTNLCQGKKVLELGIGTGRIAVPLKQKGIEIRGIDVSPSMVERIRAKQGGANIPVKMSTFAEFKTEQKYDLIFVVFNTFFSLQTQEEQLSCFQSVSNALTPKGLFLLETFVPNLHRFDRGQTMRVNDLDDKSVRLECSKHDLASQSVTSQVVQISEFGTKFYPIKIRYAWASELDLMAKLAEMELKERWGGWSKEAFSSKSESHISIYKKP